jgi:DNA (cytosine-5)-methyltransferase 1
MNKIRVVELFAGVGGFRLGLEGDKNGHSSSSNYKNALDSNYKIVFSNQWEPSTIKQHASEVYESRFGKENHSNEDISKVLTKNIPDHDLLVGGFPCQDYSVASSLKNSKGLYGKKGVLWWQIERILREKGDAKPKYLLLENVDRLLNSPSKQKGRDFAMILKSLDDLDYAIEWRVINAADYGMPQKRRRVFFLAYLKYCDLYKSFKFDPVKWLTLDGILAKTFPANYEIVKEFRVCEDLVELSSSFNLDSKKSPFEKSGVFINGICYTSVTNPIKEEKLTLGEIILKQKVNESFYITEDFINKWEIAKGPQKTKRITNDGFEYFYSMGGMKFPDDLNEPARTIVTGEGGITPSRFKHVIKTKYGLRRLTPIELEKINMFPENHTVMKGITDTKRAFFMGNALVIGIVERIGIELQNSIK